MEQQFRVNIQAINDETAVISLFGDITTFTHKLIHEAYDQACALGYRNIIFYFDEDNVICSPGIPVLIDIAIEARRKNHTLLMAVPNTYFQKMFGMMGLHQHVDIFSSLEEAKSHLS